MPDPTYCGPSMAKILSVIIGTEIGRESRIRKVEKKTEEEKTQKQSPRLGSIRLGLASPKGEWMGAWQ